MATTFYEDSMERKRRMLPMSLGMASPDGVLTQNVQPGSALPMTAQKYRETALRLQKEAADAENEQPDLTAAQEYLRKRTEGGDMAMLNALAAELAGESFAPMQAQFLKRATAARDPMKLGSGFLTPEGQFVRDTSVEAERRAASKARQAQAYEQMATGLETAEQRRQDARERAQNADKLAMLGLDIRQQGLDLQRSIAANRNQGQVGSFSPAGFTPQGQQVVTNTKSGVSYLLNILPDGTPNYTPYQGAMIPKATFDKEVSAAGDLSAVAARADALVQAVEANPNAFGLRSAAVSAVPGAMQGYAAKAVGLTPAQLEARSTVLRQAAQEINELYGAALSMGEQARANTFLPNPADPPEMLISKLKAARDWAKTQMGRYSPAVTNAATQRSGGGMQAGTGGLSDAEMQELAQLRAKHKKGQQ